MSEEEVVDPFAQVREDCFKSCPKEMKAYNDCVKRITDSGIGDCESWYFDWIKCADKCIPEKAFKLTKE